MSKRSRDSVSLRSAHEAVTYSPHKRVLLSYASDDESPTHAYANEDGTVSREPVTEDAMNASGSRHTLLLHETSEAGRLQPLNGVSDEHDAEGDNSGDQSTAPGHRSPEPGNVRRNNATGQRAALGSLAYQWEDDGEEEDYDSDEADALSYLRAVRIERQNLPTVLKAPDTEFQDDIDDDDVGDTRGYWDDDAYVAAATLGPQLPDTHDARITPQEAFTNGLKARFLKQQERVRTEQQPDTGTQNVIKATFTATKRRSVTSKVRDKLLTTKPTRSKLRAMNQSNALKALGGVRTEYLRPQTDICSSISAWIWSLLAKLDDVGSMDNDQVWQIRELGKQAILVQLSFVDPTAAQQLAGAAAEDDRPEIAAVSHEDSVSQAHAEQPPSSPAHGDDSTSTSDTTRNPETTRENTLATLDAIIVIVGEIFRQRDLLEFRSPWE